MQKYFYYVVCFLLLQYAAAFLLQHNMGTALGDLRGKYISLLLIYAYTKANMYCI